MNRYPVSLSESVGTTPAEVIGEGLTALLLLVIFLVVFGLVGDAPGGEGDLHHPISSTAGR